jgi:hypothetical protein
MAIVCIAPSSSAIMVLINAMESKYIVWRTFDREIDWFVLEDGKYITMAPDRSGILCSREFSGLWLDVTQLLAGNMQMVLQTLNQGMKSANA